uniref:FAD synthase n=1 Tax=uncultured bacterium contig00008 TaxID=1181500 RepID=A0A806KND4_9BACT|nr:riboflavin biosynthesis protein RibF [uncultured bacterium contig00008]
MLVTDWFEFLENGLPIKQNLSSMTVGVFDGVHRGHQALLKRIVSHNADYVPVVVTFRENHKTGTVKNFSKETHTEAQRHGGELGNSDILTFERKTEILAGLGVEVLLVIDFTDSFRHMKGIDFLEVLLEHGNIGFFAVGGNFRCGYQLDTGAREISGFFTSRNIPVEIVPEVMEGSLPISSSRIRSCIAAGDLQAAQSMMGARPGAVWSDLAESWKNKLQ